MTTIQFRRGTDAEAAAANPVLADGEPGWTDEGTFKIGDGVTPWVDLEQVGRATYAQASDPLGLGLIYTIDPLLVSTAATVGANNRAHYFRVVSGGTITSVGLEVVNSSGNIDVGVYANSGSGRSATPGSRKGSSGSVACPAAGFASVALTASVDVEAGDWLAIAADNTTATFRAATTGIFVNDLFAGRAGHENNAFPLPATAALTAYSLHSPKLLVGVP